MGETFSRGDFLVHRATPIIDSGLDLCCGNVGGNVVAIPFTATFSATQAAVAMKICGQATLVDVVMPKAGSVVGVSARFASALTASDKPVTFEVYKNTTGTGCKCTVASSGQKAQTWQNKDLDPFVAGDVIAIKMTNSTWASAAGFCLGVAFVEI